MNKKLMFVITGIALTVSLWAGDNASFVDLGFSPDGSAYMFAEYGVRSASLKAWAELYVVDVPRNSFAPGGKLALAGSTTLTAGQDGSGVFYKLLTRNASLADRYGVNFDNQGKPLYIAGGDSTPASIRFRDFENDVSYTAALVSDTQGSGAGVKSAFRIELERNGKNYTVGNPAFYRPQIAGYRIKKVIAGPDSLIFVIETRAPAASGWDIRYMVEAIRF